MDFKDCAISIFRSLKYSAPFTMQAKPAVNSAPMMYEAAFSSRMNITASTSTVTTTK